MESLIVAILAGVAMWFAVNRGRKVKARRAERAAQSAGTMPRLGQPGTITNRQIKALKANHFEPVYDWSREEAALILDAVGYARSVLADVTGRKDHDIDTQNRVFAFVMRDAELREYLLSERPPSPPPQNAYYQRVAAFVRETVG